MLRERIMSTFRWTPFIVIFYFFSYGCCNFSEIINIDEIIGNSTLLLPTFDDQIGPGKKYRRKKNKIHNYLLALCVIETFKIPS